MSVLLAFTAACLFGIGTWLLLQRRLTRIIIGLGLIGHGTNILLLTSGGRGGLPPLVGRGDEEDFADPLPQALALTAIVITFGVMAFLLAMAYRSWQVSHDDVVADDLEDRLIRAASRVDSDVADVRDADLEASSDSSEDVDEGAEGLSGHDAALDATPAALDDQAGEGDAR